MSGFDLLSIGPDSINQKDQYMYRKIRVYSLRSKQVMFVLRNFWGVSGSKFQILGKKMFKFNFLATDTSICTRLVLDMLLYSDRTISQLSIHALILIVSLKVSAWEAFKVEHLIHQEQRHFIAKM